MDPADRGRLLDVLHRAQDVGFIGPGDVEAHLLHAQAFAGAVADPPGRALDLGSGGGVPGLVLAMIWPASDWVLLDASLRRTTFLGAAVAELGWSDRVGVHRERAERAGRNPALRGRFDLVVARAFAGPAITAECGAPFLRVGGRLLVSDPPEKSGRWPARGLAALGLAPGGTTIRPDPPATIQSFVQVGPCPDDFPRRTGIPAKRPLWPNVSRETSQP